MPVNQLIYQGVVFTLVQEAPGWTAFIPRFGRTMYFSSRDEAIDEAIRLIEAFQAPRLAAAGGVDIALLAHAPSDIDRGNFREGKLHGNAATSVASAR